jgi:hypothetical protein
MTAAVHAEVARRARHRCRRGGHSSVSILLRALRAAPDMRLTIRSSSSMAEARNARARAFPERHHPARICRPFSPPAAAVRRRPPHKIFLEHAKACRVPDSLRRTPARSKRICSLFPTRVRHPSPKRCPLGMPALHANVISAETAENFAQVTPRAWHRAARRTRCASRSLTRATFRRRVFRRVRPASRRRAEQSWIRRPTHVTAARAAARGTTTAARHRP